MRKEKIVTRSDKFDTAEVECPFVYLNGCEAKACLDWNDYYFELWFEVSQHMYDSVDEFPSLQAVIDEADEDFDDIAVLYCRDLDEVNWYVNKYDGDRSGNGFDEDEWLGIVARF